MHLSGYTDASDLLAADPGGGEGTPDRCKCGIRPVAGILLGPQGLLHRHVLMRHRNGGGFFAIRIEQKGARTTGSDVDTEPIRTHPRAATMVQR
jgi:hypothetical protein